MGEGWRMGNGGFGWFDLLPAFELDMAFYRMLKFDVFLMFLEAMGQIVKQNHAKPQGTYVWSAFPFTTRVF